MRQSAWRRRPVTVTVGGFGINDCGFWFSWKAVMD